MGYTNYTISGHEKIKLLRTNGSKSQTKLRQISDEVNFNMSTEDILLITRQ